MLRGGIKQAAKYYKSTLGLFAIAIFINASGIVFLTYLDFYENGIFAVFCEAQLVITFGMQCILIFSNDIGERKSIVNGVHY